MKDFKLDTNEKITSGFKVPDHYFDTFQKRYYNNYPKQSQK